MEPVPFSKARNQLSDIVNHAAFMGERIVITRNGRPMVAIISIEDLETYEALEDRLDLEAARKAMREIEKEGSIPWEDAKRELGL